MHVQFKLFDLSLFDLSTLALSVCGYLQSTESDGAKIFLIVYHPIHTHTSVFVSSLTPPISQLFGILSRRFFKPLWDIIAMISVSLFALYLIAKLVNEGEVTKAETMTIGEIFDYIKKGSAKLAPFDLTKKKMMNVILDPIEDSTESQAEKTYSLLAFDGLQSSFAGQKSVSLLTSCFF
ncbi:hypothetical protein Bca52824_083505 [Brassica carinata]|uniref:Uncharacterized protein n=1 Tax=Brassica carinata TaxID=52824 RepID=A0A8X7PJ81_BRACI|nr:hypothetical protein Bca52824_083505 [Brassica carinata]